MKPDRLLRIILSSSLLATVRTDYASSRNDLVVAERLASPGGALALSPKERAANGVLVRLKAAEVGGGSPFLASRHFFAAKADIERSAVFRLIRRLPKGANLHSRLPAMLPVEALLEMVHRDAFVCVDGDRYTLSFMNHTFGGCAILDKARNLGRAYQDAFRPMFSLYHSEPDADLANNLRRVSVSADGVEALLRNPRFLRDYFYEALRVLYDDNVMYLEFRATVADVGGSPGTFTDADLMEILKNVTERFVGEHPGWLGAKLIVTAPKGPLNYTIGDALRTVEGLQRRLPGFVAGFDIWNRDRVAAPIDDFRRFAELRNATDFYFHAGEADRFETNGDLNVIDAVLLGTRRVAGGSSILKHPEVLKMLKDRDIPVEISPIFDQVVGLVPDLANHPGSYLLANNYSVVITNDSPTALNSGGLSYDWYMVFMGMASADGDLRFLKQLAINSLSYSAYEDKGYALQCWERRWDEFLDRVLEQNVAER